MSPTPAHDEDEAEPPLLYRVTWTTLACIAATALFVLVSGVRAGGGTPDARLLVAQCWHDIEDKQITGLEAHRLRVGCQALESSLIAPPVKPATTVVASQE